MLDSPLLALLLLLPLLVAVALIVRLRRRLADEAFEAARWRRKAEDRARALGLLKQEIQGPGLALLGQAGTLAPDRAGAIAAEAQHLLRLVDELTEYLATEAGPRRLEPAPLPLLPLLEESVAAVSAQLGPGSRQWRLAPELNDVLLRADRRALRGALTQILARSARMTREGDWIELRPVVGPDGLAIVIEDEGAGLPAEDLAPGAPAGLQPGGSEGTRGLSFGLAVARALLEAHGGALRLEALPGVGARAWLTLPRERVITA